MKYLVKGPDGLYLKKGNRFAELLAPNDVKQITEPVFLCKTAVGDKVYVLTSKTVPEGLTAVESKRCLSHEAYLAVMVFEIKLQLAFAAKTLGNPILGVLGALENILKGE